MAYVVRKYNQQGRRIGFVKCEGQPWKAAIFPTYAAAKRVADFGDTRGGISYDVDLHERCDCADDLMIHA